LFGFALSGIGRSVPEGRDGSRHLHKDEGPGRSRNGCTSAEGVGRPRSPSSALRLEIGSLVRDTALRLAVYGRGTLTNLPPTNQDADL